MTAREVNLLFEIIDRIGSIHLFFQLADRIEENNWKLAKEFHLHPRDVEFLRNQYFKTRLFLNSEIHTLLVESILIKSYTG
jgi:hypothetical protein